MAIYLPVTNPLRLWPLTELNPRTLEADYCRPRIFFAGDAVRFQIIADGTPGNVRPTDAAWEEPDGTRHPFNFATGDVNYTASVFGTRSVYIVRVRVPDLPLCRLSLDFLGTAGGGRFESGWVTTTADRSRVVRLRYYAYESGDASVSEAYRVALDTYFPAKPINGGYYPYIYVPGGFFTSGFAPSIDDEGYLTERYVSRYTHARPRVSRTLVIGDARGVDNATVETVNAALCLTFEVEGRRYVRYDSAQLEPLGDRGLPLTAWSIALQSAEGDASVLWSPGEEAAGAVIDASGRYVTDAAGKYVKS